MLLEFATITINVDPRPMQTALETWAGLMLNAWIYVMRHEHADDRRFAETIDFGGEG